MAKKAKPLGDQPRTNPIQPQITKEAMEFVQNVMAGKIPAISLARSPEPSDSSSNDLATGHIRNLSIFESDSRVSTLRFQFLQACRELEIPESRWPRWGDIPSLSGHSLTIEPGYFKLPPFDVRRDTAETYIQRATILFRKHASRCAKDCNARIREAQKNGFVVLVPQSRRDMSPGESKQTRADNAMRLRWAALHYCEGMRYREIHKSRRHNPNRCGAGQITTAAKRLLATLGLKKIHTQ